MSDLQVTLWVFLLFFVPGLILCLGAMAHDAIERRVRRGGRA